MKYRTRNCYSAKQRAEIWDPLSAMQASPAGQWVATWRVNEFHWSCV